MMRPNMRGQDPFGSMQGMFGQLRQFMGNPVQYMMQNRLNIPQNLQNAAPNDITQYLLNSGTLTQQQYNWANNLAKQIQSNPQYQQFMRGMR